MKKKEVKENTKLNKNIIVLFCVFVIVVTLTFILSKREKELTVDNNDNTILSLGEKKYLEFLWMVDGAFNDERYNNESFKVNGKTLKNKPAFTCKYDESKTSCYSTNFEKSFKELFASNVDINRVYGDGLAIRLYEKRGDKYKFTNKNTCEAGRMDLNHKLEVDEKKENTDNEVTYKVTWEDDIPSGIYKGKRTYRKEFVLTKEDGEWKISKAYYHDPCRMEYIIGES